MPAWLVKLSTSPDRKFELIDTVAPVSLPLLSTSLTDAVPSSVTAEPPPSKVAVPPAVTAGAVWTTSSVLVAVLLVPLLVEPSVTVQLMVRLVSPPPPVGSPLSGLKL